MTYDLVAVIDPVSKEAQRLSEILLVLRRSLPCSITVILNPVAGMSDLPLKKLVNSLNILFVIIIHKKSLKKLKWPECIK